MQLNLRPRSGFSKLPPELIDIVVDNFSEDKSSLLSCSLLGPLWTHASHRILFRSLTLTGEKGTDEERIPLALIRQRPRFLPYIHELRFIPTVVWRTLITVHPHTFRVLLSLCTGLRSLVIKALRLHGSPPDAAIAAMFESTRRITLDRLDLSTRDVPDRRGLYAIFDALEEVKELRIGVACYNSTVLCAPDAPDLTGRYYLPVSSITLTGEDLGVCMMAVGRALDPHMLRSTRLTNIGLRHLSYANEFLSILPLSLDDLDISFQAPRHAFVSRTRGQSKSYSYYVKPIR
ncbi:hypothetical protein PHLCEN_2v4091 [Hermanssonia centrifuga]|uniref:F-box domain-containing protein n=1 Tax=Hermanssonia centrifuga TaxID=98765 RepID=A0A2R6Q294_9APHY|nr:hypothetical protein PHLCEN_2v4091 [Hermanssonia centrifuga]